MFRETLTGDRRVIGFVGILAVLVLSAVAFSSSGYGSTAALCAPTGNEALTSDRDDYQPGDTVHVSGSGFAPFCGVSIEVTRPDAVVEGETVDTDAAGTLTYDYVLAGLPGIPGTYGVEAIGQDDTVLASFTFEDAVQATASVNLTSVYRNSGALTYTFTINNTSIDASTIGSVRITRPNTTWASIACPGAPAGWSAVAATATCTYNSAAGTGDNIAPGGSSSAFQVTASTTAGVDDLGQAWAIRVNTVDTFSLTGDVGATASSAGALAANAYGVAATASVDKFDVYRNASGLAYTFTVNNSTPSLPGGGTAPTIGSVQITRPSTTWVATACPDAPAGWSVAQAAATCTYNSAAGTGDNIALGAGSSAFQLTANTTAGASDLANTWAVRVHTADTYSATGDTAATASSAGALAANAYGLAGTASVDVKDVYRGVVGLAYTFTVNNSTPSLSGGGTAPTIGSVRITRPSTNWTVTACPGAPAGWSVVQTAATCTYNSAAGTGDNIALGAGSSAFQLTASTSTGGNDLNTWSVEVATADTFAAAVAATESSTGSLAANAYTFEITDAVVAASAATIGGACPAANKSAAVGSSQTIVVCGTNHFGANLTPASGSSSLGGTFIGTPGTFASGSVGTTANIVLANYNTTTISSSGGTGKTVVASIGSLSSRTSPSTTLTGYTTVKRATSTSVSCSPGSVVVGQGSTCTATVTDTESVGSKSDPAGSVAFGSTGSGSFSSPGTSCTLVSDGNAGTFTSTCAVTYTPSGASTHDISGDYTASDGTHEDSSTTTDFSLSVSLRSTSTAVVCSPASVVVAEDSTCTATVTDTEVAGSKSDPSGSVAFGTDGAGGFSPAASCTLVSDGNAGTFTSSCAVMYMPSSAASTTHNIDGDYTDDNDVHSDSSDADGFDVTVALRSTSTAVDCTPTSVVVAEGTTCTATVTDTESAGTKSSPGGTVTFGHTGSGSFDNTSCTLSSASADSSSCSVTYTPSSAASTTHTITGDYTQSGDVHSDSSDAVGSDVTVSLRDTSTAISCSPSSVVVAQGTTCTATVTDTESAGTKSSPDGSVAFGHTGSGSFSPAASCTLSPATSDSSDCSVTYTPSSAASTTHNVDGDYTASGDVHSDSSDADGFDVTVGLRSTSTAVVCSPASVVVAEGSTCTATVTDTDSAGSKSDPGGSVAFGHTGSGSFSNPGTSCTLVSDGNAGTYTSTCSVTYTPSSAASTTHNVDGDYTASGDVHSDSSDADGFDVTVGLRSTSTAVVCSPASVVVGNGSTCTATVTDTDSAGSKSDPAGSVAFSSTGAGSFSSPGTSCTLVSDGNAGTFTSGCSVTYTPSSSAGSPHTVDGSYTHSGDVHSDSDDPDGFDVAVTEPVAATHAVKVWIGLKNSDDVGTRFDLRATLTTPSGTTTGTADNVAGGSSGFNNAHLYTIGLADGYPGAGTTANIRLKLEVRVSCASGHTSGTARLWYNDSGANSRIEEPTGTPFKYLRSGLALNSSAGSTRSTVDVVVSKSGCPSQPESNWKSFGTWQS